MKMLNMKQVRDRLGLSASEVIRLVQDRRLKAYRYTGSGRLGRTDLTPDVQGLRFKEQDVDELVEASVVN